MNIITQYTIYKKSLKDFESEFGESYSEMGLCAYFYVIHNVEYGNIQELSILYSLRPCNTAGFWYPQEDVKSRINILKRSIEICEKKMGKVLSRVVRKIYKL